MVKLGIRAEWKPRDRGGAFAGWPLVALALLFAPAALAGTGDAASEPRVDTFAAYELKALDRFEYHTRHQLLADHFVAPGGYVAMVEEIDAKGAKLEHLIGVPDPVEGFNRSMFAINDVILLWFFRPVARGYSYVVPHELREGINGVAKNVEFPARMFSCLLQGRAEDAGMVGVRFLINTTLGIAGAYDVANAWFNMRPRDEDFGQAFASWGIGTGCYLFLPLEGSSCARDAVGSIFDKGFDPKTYIPVPGVGGGLQFNKASLKVDQYSQFADSYRDPYVPMQLYWILKRKVQTAK